ncbi:MAG: hypothetical protein KGJ13_04225 [Patescibacteria group bacterium]|nr:hypothetical protein [Patescibacteria group bacterium]
MIAELKQIRLQEIVSRWEPHAEAEFRGFRCGRCDEPLLEGAYHHLLDSSGYLVWVHLCGHCDRTFKTEPDSELEIVPGISREHFHPFFSKYAETVLDRIAARWNPAARTGFGEFTCDLCGAPLSTMRDRHPNFPTMARGWHVWRNKNGVLIEYHFCSASWEHLLKL